MGAIKHLTDADGGTTITTPIGEPIAIELVENPSTGYVWQLAPTDGLDVTSDYVADDHEEGVVGSGGHRTFIITPTRPGPIEVALVHGRSWAPDPTDQTFRVTLDVKSTIDETEPAADQPADDSPC